jgi:hypothetical protein
MLAKDRTASVFFFGGGGAPVPAAAKTFVHIPARDRLPASPRATQNPVSTPRKVRRVYCTIGGSTAKRGPWKSFHGVRK